MNDQAEYTEIVIKDSSGKTFASMLHEAIERLENEVYFPAIIMITPKYSKSGLTLTVAYDPTK